MTSSTSTRSTTSIVLTTLATVAIVRTVWTTVIPAIVSKTQKKNGDDEDGTNDSSRHHNVDMTNPTTLVQKVKEVMDITYEICDDVIPNDMSWPKLYCSFLSLLHAMDEIDTHHPEWRDAMMNSSSTSSSSSKNASSTSSLPLSTRSVITHTTKRSPSSLEEISESDVEVLLEYFEYAELAYEANQSTITKTLWEKGRYKLIRLDNAVEPGRVGHYLAINYTKKQVLVGIKGTSDLGDIFTHIVCKAVPVTTDDSFLKEEEDKKENETDESNKRLFYCHEGILTATKMIMEETYHLISNLFVTEYEIAICGHSLGAGVATLLGMFLKHRLSANLNLRVYAYATPPCCSVPQQYFAATSGGGGGGGGTTTKSYITSIVNNNDCIPRMSLTNIQIMHKLLSFVDSKLEMKGLSPTDMSSARKCLNDLKRTVNDADNLLLNDAELTHFFQTEFDKIDRKNSKLHSSSSSSPSSGTTTIIGPTATATTTVPRSVNNSSSSGSSSREDHQQRKQPQQPKGVDGLPLLLVPGKVISMWNNTKDPSIIGCKITTGLSPSLRQIFIEKNMISDHSCDMYRTTLLNLLEQTANTI